AQDAVSNENAVEPLDEDVATVLAALDAGEDPFDALDPTAAVVDGGGGHAGGSSFVRLLHVIETTEPLELAYRLSDDPALGLGSDGASRERDRDQGPVGVGAGGSPATSGAASAPGINEGSEQPDPTLVRGT